MFELRGVKHSLLKRINDLIGDQDQSCAEVSATIIGSHEILNPETCRWGNKVKPEDTITGASQTSLADLLGSEYKSTPHPLLGFTYDEVIGCKANLFVSFAYSMKYSSFVSILEEFISNTPGFSLESTYLWVDFVVNNQWVAIDKSFEWWSTTFMTAIGDIGFTCVVFDKYRDCYYLKRAWCLWEAYCSVKSNAKIEIALSSDERQKLFDAVSYAAEYCYHTGRSSSNIHEYNIDFQKADCFVPSDKENIFNAVTLGIGFSSINKIIADTIDKNLTIPRELIEAKFYCQDFDYDDCDDDHE